MVFVLLLIYLCHYLADYILQFDEMAKRKVKDLVL